MINAMLVFFIYMLSATLVFIFSDQHWTLVVLFLFISALLASMAISNLRREEENAADHTNL